MKNLQVEWITKRKQKKKIKAIKLSILHTSTVKQPKYATHPAAKRTSPTTLTSESLRTMAFSDHLSFSPPRPPSNVSALLGQKIHFH